MLLLPPLALPEEAATLELGDGRAVHFWSLFPLYREEMDFKLQQGVEALLPMIEEQELTEVIDKARPNMVARRGGWPF